MHNAVTPQGPTTYTARVHPPTVAPPAAWPPHAFDAHERYRLTPTHLERDGTPFVPVSGELHFSRVPRAHWRERLQLMRAGGVTAVATYVFWLHHEPRRGERSFEGELDAAAFVRLCIELDLAVVLRIGPWCHGEARNGGLPDWVQHSGTRLRTNDPDYLALVADWFAALGEQLAPLCTPDGNVLAVQIENELYDQPEHIATIKQMARAVGLRAPLFTATAWGGAQLPPGEVVPLYGGYSDGFWVDADQPWNDTFHEHFFFSDKWDDPGIGADIAQRPADAPAERAASIGADATFPAATCELGGGMATAYHRRPKPTGRDIVAVANTKLGNGSTWQGYYMFAGGSNPAPDLQESQATEYPNDLPRFDYDFHAPIGAAGLLTDSHGELRRQNAFLAAFGAELAPMPGALPDVLPSGLEDRSTPRWAVRSNGESGFIFVNWHEPFDQLDSTAPVRFEIALPDASVTLPDQPLTVPGGTVARWPLRLEVGGIRIEWATASLLTRLPGDVETLVLVTDDGIPPRLAVADSAVVTDRADGRERTRDDSGALAISSAEPVTLRIIDADRVLDVLVLPALAAAAIWVLDAAAERVLALSAEPLTLDPAGALRSIAPHAPRVQLYDPRGGAFVPQTATTTQSHGARDVEVIATREADPTPASYGERSGRATAPTTDHIDDLAGEWTIHLPVEAADPRAVLSIDWAGDVAVLSVEGVAMADRFWDGSIWHVRPGDLGATEGTHLRLQIMPLHPHAAVHLPTPAREQRAANDGLLCTLGGMRLELHANWHLTPSPSGDAP